MNRILILAHAPLAHALRQCALHVFPEGAADIEALDAQPNTAPEETLASARIMLDQLQANADVKGVLVLTDMFGATPCNVARKLVDDRTSKLITGVNLPMVMRCMSYRNEAIELLAARAVAGGIQGVMQVALTAPQNQKMRDHDQDERDHQQ